MITRKHKSLLFAFLLIAVVSVVYVGGNYAGLGRLFGSRGYVVTAQLADSGGIFTNAEVAYRGVTVGRVGQLHLTDSGVSVDLDLDPGGPDIPADTTAVVANRSAVGEQFVDLQPQHTEGPYLADGSVIKVDKTRLPLAPDTVLSNLDKLVSSVDPRSVRTVVDEAHTAFNGTGPDLQALLDTAGSFTATAKQNLPQTKDLLAKGKVVLDTQRRQGDNITSLATGLAGISDQLKKSDPDVRKVIDQAPPVARQVSDVLATSGTSLGVVIANLLTTAQVTTARTDSLEELLVAYPVISSFTRSVTSNGEGHLGLVLNFFDPHSCTKGYEGTKQRAANDTSEAPANKLAYCAEPPGSPTGVRGAQNAPYAGKPVAPVAPKPQAPAPQAQRLPGVLGLATSGAGPAGLGGLFGLAG
ncbi:MCE family protein [Amycolatopsis sp. CA-230715]|uniref:MCE family protein n=1 Tax=Amycolatopsis sp. CA-230715 TaxID=2745196 RepID=UPI001C013B2F|nr:MlaD family protein [Amycolatopsis sp. CA-230715]QWF77539.1 hypothetical protein HUW46_00931 [Amycolatopsis sp. CA-230715]